MKDYKLLMDIGFVGGNINGTCKKISIIKWKHYPEPTIDIRKWKDGEPSRGISLSYKEGLKLLELLKDGLNVYETVQEIDLNLYSDNSDVDDDSPIIID